MAMEKTSVSLASDQVERIDRERSERRISKSDLVRELIDRGFQHLEDERRRNKLARQMAGLEEAVPA